MTIMIDFGTSTLRIRTSKREDTVAEASVVARRAEGVIVAGNDALKMEGRAPQSVDITRPIEAGAIKDADAAVLLLKTVVEQNFARLAALRMPMLIALPWDLSSVEQRGMEEVAHNAGAKNVKFFDSLVAAAIGADVPMDAPSGSLVVDLGAGTTEVGLLSMRGIVSARRMTRGMFGIDEEIMDAIRREYGFLVSRHAVEYVKNELLNEEKDEYEMTGRSLATGLPCKVQVRRDVFVAPLMSHYDQVIELVRGAIETCPPELVGDIMDKGVVLVGGGANGYRIEQALGDRIEVPVTLAQDPGSAVIRGLAKLAADENKNSGDIRHRALRMLKTS
ncbi:rod shape-determining protein [Alicyclobacillus dauci]|uniref:Rod shape-determining protein n=1 Tax=Alicyclobacillus dauci TaxID=1475485 RepID=A0ABY6YYX5_9BACL|nr:rod shape-determining protein [Alicyclobacillus dauci]WAH35279.1 rod shape-determining protein [Alicyclobacillus dauci]